MEDWAEIRRLHRAEGLPIKTIAQDVGGLAEHGACGDAPRMGRRSMSGSRRGRRWMRSRPRIREQLQAVPTMPATVIAERVGWTRGITVFKERVAELRPAYLPPDPASRTTYVAGEIAQCDLWFPPIQLPVGFGQARTADAVAGADDGDRLLPVALGGADPDPARRGPVRRLVAADRARSGRCRGCWSGTARARSAAWRGGRIELTGDCQAFRGVLGTKVIVLQARASPSTRASSNAPTTTWSARSCPAGSSPARRTSTPSCRAGWRQVNARRRRALGCAPTDRIAADRPGDAAAAAGRRRRPGGGPRRGWPATTTCAWTPTTTRCTPA